MLVPQDTLRQYLNLLSTSLDGSIYKKQVKTFLSVYPGNHFQDFELYDADNNLIKFSNVAKDKVVLVHFWFSSCTPCRIQNSKLLHIYNSYKAKGFEIVGISTDCDKADFVKTIHDDKMSWINLIDRSNKSGVQYIYEITSFPSNLLIDKNGIIVKKNIPLDRLEPLIDSLLRI